jgi:hypothetical protein
VIGAGQRPLRPGGQALAHPERLRIVAVAEPDTARRAAMAQGALGADRQFGIGASCSRSRGSPTSR